MHYLQWGGWGVVKFFFLEYIDESLPGTVHRFFLFLSDPEPTKKKPEPVKKGPAPQH